MTLPRITYPRAPSEELRSELSQGGYLAPLIGLNRRKFKGTELHVHFRANDWIHVYCGLTAILKVQRLRRPNGNLNIDAHKRYKVEAGEKGIGIFRSWNKNELGLGDKIEEYLNALEVNSSFTSGEGSVQSLWSQVTNPWIPFDREAALNYESMEHRKETRMFSEVEAAFKDIEATARASKWSPLKRVSERSKADQLAVDPEGRLVILELKDASANDKSVYYVPYQLLQYIWEWRGAMESVRADLQKLIDDRVAFGLIPTDIPQLTGGIRAAVGFGRDQRTQAVKGYYSTVFEIANHYLPPDICPIETWEHTGSGPHLVI